MVSEGARCKDALTKEENEAHALMTSSWLTSFLLQSSFQTNGEKERLDELRWKQPQSDL